MSRRAFGAVALLGALLVSWAARSQPVDPAVRWNSFLGGAQDDALKDIVRNEAGDLFIVGTTRDALSLDQAANDAGTLVGAPAGSDVFVARLRGDGGLIWLTLLGQSSRDEGTALALEADGGALYVGGTTNWVPGGGEADAGNGFIVRLESSTGSYTWSFVLGGSGEDEVHDLSLGPQGELYAVGETDSADFLGRSGSVQGREAFVTRFDVSPAAASVHWNTLLSAPGAQRADAVALEQEASLQPYVYVAGTTHAAFTTPTQNAWSGGTDAFVTRLLSNTGGLMETLYLGGEGDDETRALAFDARARELVWMGNTRSTAFPGTEGARGPSDVFISAVSGLATKLNVRTSVLLGGAEEDTGHALALGRSSDIYVGGTTRSADLASGGFDTSLGGQADGFVAKVRLDGTTPAIPWVSFVGGSADDDTVLALEARAPGSLLIGGTSSSEDLRYTEAGTDLSPSPGGPDAFVLSVDTTALPRVPPPPPSEPVLPRSPLGWSCATSEGAGVLALGTLAGLALGASRRRRRP